MDTGGSDSIYGAEVDGEVEIKTVDFPMSGAVYDETAALELSEIELRGARIGALPRRRGGAGGLASLRRSGPLRPGELRPELDELARRRARARERLAARQDRQPRRLRHRGQGAAGRRRRVAAQDADGRRRRRGFCRRHPVGAGGELLLRLPRRTEGAHRSRPGSRHRLDPAGARQPLRSERPPHRDRRALRQRHLRRGAGAGVERRAGDRRAGRSGGRRRRAAHPA